VPRKKKTEDLLSGLDADEDMPNEELYKLVRGPDFVWIKPEKAEDMKRIVNSLVTQQFWFIHFRWQEEMTLIFHKSVDLQKDIRDRLLGVKFEIL
jgi:hypothetical protein